MKSVPIILSALLGIATALPVASYAQTSSDQPQTQAPARQNRHAPRQSYREEYRQHYEKLSTADKQKVDQINRQIRQLHQQELQILGMSRPRATPPAKSPSQ